MLYNIHCFFKRRQHCDSNVNSLRAVCFSFHVSVESWCVLRYKATTVLIYITERLIFHTSKCLVHVQKRGLFRSLKSEDTKNPFQILWMRPTTPHEASYMHSVDHSSTDRLSAGFALNLQRPSASAGMLYDYTNKKVRQMKIGINSQSYWKIKFIYCSYSHEHVDFTSRLFAKISQSASSPSCTVLTLPSISIFNLICFLFRINNLQCRLSKSLTAFRLGPSFSFSFLIEEGRAGAMRKKPFTIVNLEGP